MPLPQETAERFSAEVTCLAADATKVILAARANRSPRGHLLPRDRDGRWRRRRSTSSRATARSTSSAAARALAVNAELFFGPLVEGVVLPIGTGIRYQPAAAGPSVHVVVEGYYGVAK
jgi:hypothetical protein